MKELYNADGVFASLEKSIFSNLIEFLKSNSFFLYKSYVNGENIKLKYKDIIIVIDIIIMIGFLISFIDKPML